MDKKTLLIKVAELLLNSFSVAGRGSSVLSVGAVIVRLSFDADSFTAADSLVLGGLMLRPGVFFGGNTINTFLK